MNARRTAAFALGHALLIAWVGACRDRAPKQENAPTSASFEALETSTEQAPVLAHSEPSLPNVPALPEDPEAGARSVAEWREHLREEERERRLSYDRRRERQHREVIQRLHAIRQSYANATNERAIRRAQEQLARATPKLEKSFDAIDHWRVSSTLVPEYTKLVEFFSSAYPEARIAAFSGDHAALAATESDLAARFVRIDEQLREALESEDE